jgi:hypothetical protein
MTHRPKLQPDVQRGPVRHFSGVRKVGIVIASSLCAALTVLVGAGADVIQLVAGSGLSAKGGQVSGQIVSESPTEVKIKAATGEQSVPVDQIEGVTYDTPPPSFQLAVSRANTGQLSEAADLYQKAVGEARGKPLLERAAAFGRAQVLTDIALVDPSKRAEAAAALDAFVKANPASRQLGPALLGLARLRLSEGDTASAEAVLEDLSTRVPWATDRAAVLKARVLARKGDNVAAIAALDALIAAAPPKSTMARHAKLAKAESLAALKRPDDAEALVREVIVEAPAEDDLVQAVAYNTLGDCMLAAGRPKDALLAYLKTDILYSDAKDEHARALAKIRDIWLALKQDQRSAEVAERLRGLYPQSPYAKSQ